MINGHIMMTAMAVAPAEEQTCGAPFEGQCHTAASVLVI